MLRCCGDTSAATKLLPASSNRMLGKRRARDAYKRVGESLWSLAPTLLLPLIAVFLWRSGFWLFGLDFVTRAGIHLYAALFPQVPALPSFPGRTNLEFCATTLLVHELHWRSLVVLSSSILAEHRTCIGLLTHVFSS
jgi:hypothetical protein